MTLSEAVDADRAGEIEAAAAKYEAALEGGDRSLHLLLNLAILYWQATDTGIAAASGVSGPFYDRAWGRCQELLREAERRFPSSTEPRFWKKYIAWADLGEPFDRGECEALLREDPTTLVPAIYPLDGEKEEVVLRELLRQCREDGTMRSRYVASVVEGMLKRVARPK